jgi:hypothetical protein
MQVLRRCDREGFGHADEASNCHCGAGRVAAELGDLARLNGKRPFGVPPSLLSLVLQVAAGDLDFLCEDDVGRRTLEVAGTRHGTGGPRVRVGRVDCP